MDVYFFYFFFFSFSVFDTFDTFASHRHRHHHHRSLRVTHLEPRLGSLFCPLSLSCRVAFRSVLGSSAKSLGGVRSGFCRYRRWRHARLVRGSRRYGNRRRGRRLGSGSRGLGRGRGRGRVCICICINGCGHVAWIGRGGGRVWIFLSCGHGEGVG